MKSIPSGSLLLALGAGWLGISAVQAQEGRLTLIPPLSEIFPTENLPDGVHLEHPVLINDHTVLRPDAILRFVFLDANAGAHGRADLDDGANGFHAQVGPSGPVKSGEDKNPSHDTGGAAGWGNNDGSDSAGIFDDKKDDMKRRKEELHNEVWKMKDLFDDALEHATELGTTLVYSLPKHEDVPLTASFDLPEGMLLSEMQGHVRVLGLKEESRSYVGGVRPGDEIRSFKGAAPVKNLDDFMREYSETKRLAKISGDPNYGLEIWRPGTGQTISVQVAAPPSIPSFLKDSFSAPLDQKQ